MSTELTKAINRASKDIAVNMSREATAVRSLREFNEHQIGHDPARVAWPSSLVLELALKTATPQELKEHYGFSDEEWAALRENETFLAELGAMVEEVKKDGMSFKLKARLQAEAMLETSWRLVHAPGSEVAANVKADLIKTTFRVAGFDNKEAAAGAGGGQFNIQINLG